MKRIKYELFSKNTKKSTNPLIYKYSNTPNIEISVAKTGFYISVYRTVKKDAKESLSDPLFRDAVKKCCLIQLIKYGAISFKELYAKIDGAEEMIYSFEDGPLIYGLCGDKLCTRMSSDWGATQFNRILHTVKSKENRIDAALYALVMAKSKTYVTEKFIYLWMAMNGLYGYMAEKAFGCMDGKNEKGWIKREYAQLKFMALFYGYQYCTPDNDKVDSFRLQMELALAKTNDFTSDQAMQQLRKSVEEVLAKFEISDKMSIEAALLLYFPYLVRCKYFHSEKALPLLCFEEEHPLPVIRVLNLVLEKFLDENLCDWMNEQKLIEDFYPRIEMISKGCKCDKNKHLQSCVIDGKEHI